MASPPFKPSDGALSNEVASMQASLEMLRRQLPDSLSGLSPSLLSSLTSPLAAMQAAPAPPPSPGQPGSNLSRPCPANCASCAAIRRATQSRLRHTARREVSAPCLASAPKRFVCNFPGCQKVYKQQHHLQRHLRHVHHMDVQRDEIRAVIHNLSPECARVSWEDTTDLAPPARANTSSTARAAVLAGPASSLVHQHHPQVSKPSINSMDSRRSSRLGSGDMPLFGEEPLTTPLVLVRCKRCNKRVTQSFFRSHIRSKNCSSSVPIATQHEHVTGTEVVTENTGTFRRDQHVVRVDPPAATHRAAVSSSIQLKPVPPAAAAAATTTTHASQSSKSVSQRASSTRPRSRNRSGAASDLQSLDLEPAAHVMTRTMARNLQQLATQGSEHRGQAQQTASDRRKKRSKTSPLNRTSVSFRKHRRRDASDSGCDCSEGSDVSSAPSPALETHEIVVRVA